MVGGGALQIVPDVMVYSKSLRTSESIEAYLEEFPGETYFVDIHKLIYTSIHFSQIPDHVKR